MTSGMIDSKPVFLARLHSASLPQEAIDRLINGGLDTLAKLAFLAPVSPTSGEDTMLMRTLSDVMLYSADNAMPVLVASILRRIWFEAHATAISEVKNRMERGDENHPRKLPLPEREDRRLKQQTKITGFLIQGIHEPSNSLVDLFHTLKEDEQLKYVPPEVCTHREAELQGVKKEIYMQADSGGRLKQINREIQPEADVSNSYKLRLAFQRRSLAMDQMELAEFSKMEQYHEFLFDLLMQTPPPGYTSFSVPQLISVDKMVWNYMSTHCRTGISRQQSGLYPIHLALDEALRSPLITAALQPLPKAVYGSDRKSDFITKNGERSPYAGKGKDKGKGKGKSGSKGKSKGTLDLMPRALTGGHSKKDGSRICFSYNTGNCQQAKPGQSCPKGLHICCMCDASDHHFGNCPQKKS